MRLLAISEHYFPRIGGTVNYVHETLCALSDKGVEVELWVPGPAPECWLPDEMSKPPYSVRWIDAGYPAAGDPTREQRYDFCRQVDLLASESLSTPERPELLHVLFGLFLMEILDTERFQAAGLPCVATVHNVPPMECRLVAHNAPLPARLKEFARLKAVKIKNKARLKRHGFAAYVVPSLQVQTALAPIVAQGRIEVIGHGLTADLQSLMSPPTDRRPSGPVRLLTAGGYAPHKRQHILPATVQALRDMGVDVVWDVVGPAGRVQGYFDDIQKDVTQRGLDSVLRLHKAVPFDDLARLYDAANIYVQPSLEEGFCITALDAAATGLPVIGSPAGALPAIIEASGGVLVASEPHALAEAIARFSRENLWQDPQVQSAHVRGLFSWSTAAQTLLDRYAILGVDEKRAAHV
ncbi:glycosyltransferase family 4 protein [Falsihalocynthiibacter sp. S25ZX9]|uniref:glycosyltransferase family 4 protein n=1 Tax=Falsihalocynthiibacter sp. S25ZX9 TaxID=3240870 RepID=UPI003510B5FE